jgi:hypothetical protein
MRYLQSAAQSDGPGPNFQLARSKGPLPLLRPPRELVLPRGRVGLVSGCTHGDLHRWRACHLAQLYSRLVAAYSRLDRHPLLAAAGCADAAARHCGSRRCCCLRSRPIGGSSYWRRRRLSCSARSGRAVPTMARPRRAWSRRRQIVGRLGSLARREHIAAGDLPRGGIGAYRSRLPAACRASLGRPIGIALRPLSCARHLGTLVVGPICRLNRALRIKTDPCYMTSKSKPCQCFT